MPRARECQPALQCLFILGLASVVALQQHQQKQSGSRLKDESAALPPQSLIPTQSQSKAVIGPESDVPLASASIAAGDAFFIRHGRSRVRHSNEKVAAVVAAEAFFSTNTNTNINTNISSSNSNGDGDGGGVGVGGGGVSGASVLTGRERARTRLTLVTSLPPVTPTMLPSDSTSAPVTHKIRKLHKKKINESIRKSVDKSLGVVRPPKNHRSLAEAEHLQGRPTDVEEDVNDAEGSKSALGEVMQLADEIDLDNSIEAAYQSADVDETTAGDERGVDDDGGSDMELYGSTTPRPTAFVTEADVVGSAAANRVSKATIWLTGQNHFDLNRTRSRASPMNELDANLMSSNTEDSTESDYGLDETHYSQQKQRTHGIDKDDEDENENAEDGDGDDDEGGGLNDVVGDSSVQYILDEALGENVTLDEHFHLDASTTQSTGADWPEEHSMGPRESASTSVLDVGIGLVEQQINFDNSGVLDTSEITMDDGYPPEVLVDDNSNQLVIGDVEGDGDGDGDGDGLESDQIRADVINARDSKIDLVSKFLQYIEHQHLLGSNCVAGTSLNLGEGVVDRYAQDRFRVEAEVAVNRANMLTRIFKMTSRSVQEDVNLLHASVLSMVEFDDDIFAAGNCFDWNEHPAQPGLFCPFAYRLPPPNLGAVFAKDLATEYHYLGNTSEWFFLARKNAEKVIAHNEQYLKSFHLYSNRTDERIEADTLAVKYEDGRWSKPYYDCGGGNIWMLTYTVPFFGYENGTYHFKGTSGIDIDLRRVDIDQCPQRSVPGAKRPLNIFAGTDKCKQRTTMCEAINGLGFRRGSYKCICRKGYYFPDVVSTQKFFNGSLLEEEYEKLMLGKNSTYSSYNEYECLPCAEGCDSCEDGSPCIAALNWPMRTSILLLACVVIGLLPPAAWFTFRYQQVKVVRAASPALLRVIALGAFFIYCTNIVMYPNPNLYTCTARIWLREIGFSLTYGALMLKTWRISVIFRVRSAKAVKITDAALLKRLGIICGVIGTCLLVRTLVSPPDVVVGRTADDLKAFLCKTDWWDYTFTSMEVLFLAWGVRLCIMVRKAPSEFNESRFISMAIYNEFLLTCFLNVSMLFLQSPANPDLLYIIFFCHTQLTVTLLLALIFGSKVYIVLRSGKSHQENIGMGAKSSGAKFNFRPQVRTFANPSSVTTSTAPVAGTTSAENKLSDQEALEEIRQLSVQLQRIQEMAPPKGVAVMTISSLLDGLKTPGGMMIVAAAATHAASANQNALRHQTQPLLSLNAEMQKYNQQLQLPSSNNNVAPNAGVGVGIGDGIATLTRTTRTSIPTMVLETPPSPTPPASITYDERAVNTELSGPNFAEQLLRLTAEGHIICSRCLEGSKEHYYCCPPRVTPIGSPPASAKTACEQLGSPQPEGSISFANIKLDCMCSQSDDLDLDLDRAVVRRRRPTVRSAATNTPPPTTKYQHHRSAKDGGEPDVTYQICDNCRRKYKISSKSIKRRSFNKRSSLAASEPASGPLSQTRSSDLLNRTSHGADLAVVVAKAAHSTDDITFYTTTEDDDGDDDDDSSESSQHSPARSRPSTSKAVKQHHLEPTASQKAQAASTSATFQTSAQSVGNISTNSNNSASQTTEATSKPNGSGGSSSTGGASRAKRPDKLVLDLNDRSKYTKEVSV